MGLLRHTQTWTYVDSFSWSRYFFARRSKINLCSRFRSNFFSGGPDQSPEKIPVSPGYKTSIQPNRRSVIPVLTAQVVRQSPLQEASQVFALKASNKPVQEASQTPAQETIDM
jgi:hypothetical protein